MECLQENIRQVLLKEIVYEYTRVVWNLILLFGISILGCHR
jgi:hypothetical protein